MTRRLKEVSTARSDLLLQITISPLTREADLGLMAHVGFPPLTVPRLARALAEEGAGGLLVPIVGLPT
jgi:hypothetical protein